MSRKLINGEIVEELESPVALIIWTLCPEKWKIQDMETGQVYIGNKESHGVYGEVLKNMVKDGDVGQWKKC